MALIPGTRIGPYDVTGLLGVGGMGEVYRARDTKLNRDVALKVLPDTFATDAERLARFTREAQTLASLNHPNIAAIYGLEESDGVRALVMELVEGDDLSQLIARRAAADSSAVRRAGLQPRQGLPIDEALPIAKQIAEALEAAHEQGIIHRDLKPANVKVRPDGTVKVLDFGLAKAMDPPVVGRGFSPAVPAGPAPHSQAPTMTSPALMPFDYRSGQPEQGRGLTGAGMILGTAAYMSPEQAKGHTVDKRADIWAFGCVLYEMLTGTSLFASESVAESLGLIFSREPDMAALPAGTPARVRTLIARCLQKDPKQRLRDIGEARLMLDGAFDPPSIHASVAIAAVPAWRRALPIVLAVAATAIVASFSVWTLTRPALQALVRLTMTHPAPEVVGGNQFDSNLAVSPDGRQVAYVATLPSAASSNTLRLYVRALDALEPRLLSPSARSPFFSPDGQWVGFVEDNFRLSKIPLTGGPSTRITDVGNGIRGASWGTDGTIVFATSALDTGLSRVSAAGGPAEVLTKPDASQGELDHLYPELLPGGRAVLFTISVNEDPRNSKIAVLDLTTRAYRVVLEGGSYARYNPSGYLVYGVTGALRAVGFDVTRLAVRGSPVPVDTDISMSVTGAMSFALTPDGTLVEGRGGTNGTQQSTLVWVDRMGREEPLGFEPRAYSDISLSPDGARLAARVDTIAGITGAGSDLWILSLARKTMSRLTFEPGVDGGPLWTLDGTRIVYRVGNLGVFWRPADGTGSREQLLSTNSAPRNLQPRSWSADGRLLFQDPQRGLGTIAIVSLQGDRTPKPLLVSPQFNLVLPKVSPDGRWLAYLSNESGRSEVYVRPFPDVEGGKWQVSTAGAVGVGATTLVSSGSIRWAADSRTLFFADATGIMASRIEQVPTFSASTPERVLTRPAGAGIDFDVSSDGSRFLMLKDVGGTDNTAPQLVVVLNWLQELKRLVPTP